MDVIEALKQENEQIKNILEQTRAEKIAIDQVCMNNIKENVALRTQLILTEELSQRQQIELKDFKAHKLALEQKIKDLDDQRQETEN